MTGDEIITEERKRQISLKGWKAEDDDEYIFGELAQAAIAYASPNPVFIRVPNPLSITSEQDINDTILIDPWPWEKTADARYRRDPGSATVPDPQANYSDLRIRELAKAGALIAAEIDRLLREKERVEKEVNKLNIILEQPVDTPNL